MKGLNTHNKHIVQ